MTTKKTFRLYLRYRVWKFKRGFSEGGKSMRKLRVWWQIYSVVFIATILLFIMRPNADYLVFASVSLAIMVIITVIKDYKSGAHVHWNRKTRYFHGKREEENNNRE